MLEECLEEIVAAAALLPGERAHESSARPKGCPATGTATVPPLA
jgi:hypothetical protein